MKLCKKLSLYLLLVLFTIYTNQAFCYASETGSSAASWTISQNLNKASCKQGDSVVLSVYLNNPSGKDTLTVSQLACVFEYDTDLFSVSGITGNSMSLEISDYENGNFVFSSSEGKTFADGDMLFQLKLDVEETSSVGKTTICVTDINLQEKDGEFITIQNFTPASLTIKEKVENKEDKENKENKGEETEKEPASKDETETVESVPDKTNETDKGDETVSEEKKENVVIADTSNEDNASNKKKTLDKNYETGVGLGNDIYFLIAGVFAILAVVAIVVGKKISSKMKF